MNEAANHPKGAEIVRKYYNELISYMKGAYDGVKKAKADIPEAERLLRKTETFYERSISEFNAEEGGSFTQFDAQSVAGEIQSTWH